MNAANFNKEMIQKNERIIIDTSAAMHYKGFSSLVNSIEQQLETEGKKIIVPKVVWLELIRAYNSSDVQKKTNSQHAISIISSHRNIFDIEDEEVFQDEMEQSFADPILLCDLIMSKRESRVLLITNDRMLSCDANDINHQNSCKGYKIETCYIADNGKLLPGCKHYHEEPKVIIKEVEKIVEVPVAEKVNPPQRIHPAIPFLAGLGTGAVIVLFTGKVRGVL